LTENRQYKYWVTENLPSYTCYTLFDILDKGNRSIIRNWNTIIQTISLRTQPFITRFPTFYVDNLKNYRFGAMYKEGKAKVWSFEFNVEHPDLFELNNDPIANLRSDSNLIPMIDYNQIIKPPCCLITEGDTCNTYFVFHGVSNK
jgi:hypothetical protein